MKLKLVLIIYSGPDTHTRRVSNSVNTIQWTQFSEYNPMDTIHSMDSMCLPNIVALCNRIEQERNKNGSNRRSEFGMNLECVEVSQMQIVNVHS